MQQNPQQPMSYPPQVPQPKKKNFFRTIPGIITGLVIVCCVVSAIAVAASKGGTTTPGNSGSSGSSNTSSSSSTNSSGPAKVGDKITVDDVSCTLMSVKVIQGDEFDQPKAGNEFIVVHVKIVNNSSSEFAYNVYDFHVKTGSGNVTDPEAVPPSTYTANNTLDSGNLTSGGKVEGDIVIQAPKSDHKAELTWAPSIFSSDTDNVWSLGL